VTVDSAVETIRVPAENHRCWIIDPGNDSVSSFVQARGSELVKNAEKALSIAPEWLRMALEVNCYHSSGTQESL
jgi:hypothetical protein